VDVRTYGANWVVAGLAVASCADPHYVDASGPERSSVPDAGGGAPSNIPPGTGDHAEPRWSDALKPHYALRMRFFGHDHQLGDGVQFRHEILMLGDVSVAADGTVSMQTTRCLDHGSVTGNLLANDEFSWAKPEALPVQHYELVQQAGRIQTEAPPRAIGYVEDVVGCSAGGTLPRQPDQAWLASTCTCGSDSLPQLSADCRIADDDGDGQAGITVTHTRPGAGMENARVQDNTQVRDGTIDSDGTIRASFLENYDYLGLSCGDTTPCLHNDIMPCPLALNPVIFAPIEGSWTCDRLRSEVKAGRVFPTDMLAFPKGC